MERVFAAIVMLSVMGVALFVLVGVIEKLAIPWWHNEQRQRSLN
jgi:ABC-type nitrate/sulfonate/bicarbonate transport system permease component